MEKCLITCLIVEGTSSNAIAARAAQRNHEHGFTLSVLQPSANLSCDFDQLVGIEPRGSDDWTVKRVEMILVFFRQHIRLGQENADMFCSARTNDLRQAELPSCG